MREPASRGNFGSSWRLLWLFHSSEDDIVEGSFVGSEKKGQCLLTLSIGVLSG